MDLYLRTIVWRLFFFMMPASKVSRKMIRATYRFISFFCPSKFNYILLISSYNGIYYYFSCADVSDLLAPLRHIVDGYIGLGSRFYGRPTSLPEK